MIEYQGIIYNQIEIIEADSVITISDIEKLIPKFENEKCVQNSHLVAEKINIKCVEGFVHCMVVNGDRIDDKVIRHCWNKINDEYFDVTKEFIWDKTERNTQFTHYLIAEYDSKDYDFSKGKLFLSNAVEIAGGIDEELQKQLNSDDNNSIKE